MNVRLIHCQCRCFPLALPAPGRQDSARNFETTLWRGVAAVVGRPMTCMATVPGLLALLFAALFTLWLADRENHSGMPHESHLRLRTSPLGKAESHSAVSGQPSLGDNASQWLSASVEGYCSTTSDAGDCSGGDKGTWTLPQKVVSEGWHSAAQACLGRCRECEQCRVVSLSLKFADCSWFVGPC